MIETLEECLERIEAAGAKVRAAMLIIIICFLSYICLSLFFWGLNSNLIWDLEGPLEFKSPISTTALNMN